jgi:CobQ-like glutamine amidotransferase family enzyme
VVGNVVVEVTMTGVKQQLVGFENHAGRTELGAGVAPLGRVVIGGGNIGDGQTEGCRVDRVLGTYVHGPLLPKNPWLADRLLAWGCEHRGLGTPLDALDDRLEAAAAQAAIDIARAETQTRR